MCGVMKEEMRREGGLSEEEKQGGWLEERRALREGMRKEMKGRLKPVMWMEMEEEF